MSFPIPEEWTEEQAEKLFDSRQKLVINLFGSEDKALPYNAIIDTEYERDKYNGMAMITLLQEGYLESDLLISGVRLTREGERLAMGAIALTGDVSST